MSTIYYYVKNSILDETLRYGIKLSTFYSHQLPINGIEKKCMIGLLNPKDDLNRFNSEDYTCLKLSLRPEQCYVINDVALVLPPKRYNIINLKKYLYGTFESPRIIITTSILPEAISVMNKTIDEPLLFDNSKDLYYQNKIKEMIEENDLSEVYLALCEYFDYKDKKNFDD